MDIVSKSTGDSLTAVEFNQIPSEIEGIISSAGLTPSSATLTQLTRSVAIYVANGDFYTDSGSADAYVLTAIGSQLRPDAYYDGMRVRFFPGNSNTGAACTVNVSGLGVKSVKSGTGSGSDPSAAQLTAGAHVDLTYDGTNGVFKFSTEIAASGGGGGGSYDLLVGSIVPYGATTVPTGYLECDGSAVSRTTYADLFAIIGTTWGSGDGSTTFNIPDLRGEFIRGWDHGRGVDSGRSFASSQSHQNASHTHNYIWGDGTTPATAVGSYISNANASNTTNKTTATQSSGGSEARPRNVAAMYCIRY